MKAFFGLKNFLKHAAAGFSKITWYLVWYKRILDGNFHSALRWCLHHLSAKPSAEVSQLSWSNEWLLTAPVAVDDQTFN